MFKMSLARSLAAGLLAVTAMSSAAFAQKDKKEEASQDPTNTVRNVKPEVKTLKSA